LHGTNAAVQVLGDGTVAAQSRTSIITSSNDNAGFAAWVESQRTLWCDLSIPLKDLVIFGEWCGPGIQKGVAINQAPNKIFAIFAVMVRHMQLNVAEPYQQDFMEDPEQITQLIGQIPGTYVLPWYQEDGVIFEPKIDWTATAEELQPQVDAINQKVRTVETCDPWVKAIFGVEGVGEGLVFYPISHPGANCFSNLAFKAKGEEHKVVKTKEPVQISAEVVASITDFANLVLTEARLEQGVRAVGGGELLFDVKRTGQFVGWVCKDVEKETVAELEASNLTWKQVQKTVSDAARQWYLNKTKQL
jgi:hypothetical protein